MKKTTLVLLLISVINLHINAQAIFDDSIHTAVNFGSVNSPGAEGVQNIIDQDSFTKFLDFNGEDGIGFEVDLLGVPQTAIAMEMVTANDATERDPTDFEVFGSNDGTTFTSIATGNIPCIDNRLFSRTFSFTNATAYTFYRVNFTGKCGSTLINQIADVQLYNGIGDIPVITCPVNIVANNTTGNCGAVINYTTVTANDTEDGILTPTLISGLASGSTFPVGETIVTYSVTDSDTNQQLCSFTVTVNDNENPTLNCPTNINISVENSGDTGVVVNFVDPVTTDNCGLANPIAGFTVLTNINNKVYYVSNSRLLPAEAYIDANNQNGFVGTIRNAADLATISLALRAKGINEDILIGWNDLATEGSFEWNSGDTSTFNNWSVGEPNNAGNEDYVIMLSNKLWNDVKSSITNYKYLLEVDYTQNQTAGLTSGSLFPLGTTTNTFEATDLSGNTIQCSFDVTVTTATLSINDFELNKIKIYPNPASNSITISGLKNKENFKIFDVLGTEILKGEIIDNGEIVIKNLTNGLYFLKFENSNTIKFIKK